jgi:hypothetical protein
MVMGKNKIINSWDGKERELTENRIDSGCTYKISI